MKISEISKEDLFLAIVLKCNSYILYYDKKKNHLFKVHFANDKFTGEITYCLELGTFDKVYGFLSKTNNKGLYEFIKRKALKDYYDIKEVDNEEASRIIDTYEPIGKFILEGNGVFVGIDNSTSDCWVEEFDDFEVCVDWIRAKFEVFD